MVDIDKKLVTAAEFDEFVTLPENDDRLFELIGGEIIEVPSNPYSSKIAARIILFIGMYLLKNDIGHLTGEAGGYMVSGERYAPDVAFISKVRQPKLAEEGYNPKAPDLAVEVVSPNDSERKLTIKVGNYLAAGTLLWVVYPQDKEVHVYAPGLPVKKIGIDGILDGGDKLPGFTLAVRDIFPPEPKEDE